MISYNPMGMKCANCGKGIMYGHNVSHSKRRTRKIFKPNLHRARIVINGRTHAMRLCTKCLRMVKRATMLEKETVALQATA
jgi:large subunit ribosomal protein L28